MNSTHGQRQSTIPAEACNVLVDYRRPDDALVKNPKGLDALYEAVTNGNAKAQRRQANEATEKGLRDKPIGILMLDTHIPRIPGDIGNLASYDYSVMKRMVKGADQDKVVLRPGAELVGMFTKEAEKLIEQGAGALTTSCGFMALFHKELAERLDVPLFSSSLLQIHKAQANLEPGQRVGVLTASKKSLTPAHLAAVGVDYDAVNIVGMDDTKEFYDVFIKGKWTLDVEASRQEMRKAAQDLKNETPNLGAVVLECTNMGPYARDVAEVTGVPVYDAITLMDHAHRYINGN